MDLGNYNLRMGVNVTGSGPCPKEDFTIRDVEHPLPDIYLFSMLCRHFSKVQCRVHNSPSLVLILSQMNPSRPSNPVSLRSILILSSHIYFPSVLFQSDFFIKDLYAFIFFPIYLACTSDVLLNLSF
jgi:hypothetical protein